MGISFSEMKRQIDSIGNIAQFPYTKKHRKEVKCETIGDLKRLIADYPDDAKLKTFGKTEFYVHASWDKDCIRLDDQDFAEDYENVYYVNTDDMNALSKYNSGVKPKYNGVPEDYTIEITCQCGKHAGNISVRPVKGAPRFGALFAPYCEYCKRDIDYTGFEDVVLKLIQDIKQLGL